MTAFDKECNFKHAKPSQTSGRIVMRLLYIEVTAKAGSIIKRNHIKTNIFYYQ